MHTVIFDLDGTLSDSAEGIVKSINYVLTRLGYDELPKKNLLQYIGPPLNYAFAKLLGEKDEEFLLKAIKIFRERYFSVGYKENQLYKGIRDILEQLVKQGNILCIATTKREDIAKKVLRLFDIDKYFTQVHGSDLYRKKVDLLQIMVNDPILNKRPMVMIGDRDTDFEAAYGVNIPSIAVKWGYGSEKEYEHATCIVDNPDQLPEAILKNARKIEVLT